ncbi:multifunctional CCA tRNA nucleotidyl transferase/2'3'-cyclic phosphodiesterase/2'nucleotidase/phosphatase [Chelonobacter oris]|uniref:multifunctional CCA addition/repair protein n=1 Tax=Chelonobacter oris TaxID=505317 RepID=UPI00244C1835|nr:multifunctional CCA addition/repair protein [Chelonobacter oris]MDH3001367.1 multifunctional CCA tRNA nucleotidyl transferase/2'3'-cyclic phosphodiesterase/2'nucleotidase/phosphatase [Chelonobacter oris]
MKDCKQPLQCYLVGGAVRDSLLNLPVKDRDWVVVGATPQQLLTCGYRQVGQDFPVFLHPQSKEEYALARTERKSGHGYQGFDVDFTPDITLEQDLLRRDLTINAIAQDTNGKLHDPYGGLQDLQQRILRHVSPAFAEDPLRVLRVARFHARFARLGFRVAEETLQFMQKISASGELQHLTAERIWLETEKALSSDSPQIYFQTLHECGALAVLFPEIDALFGVPNPPQHHPEIDSGIHTLMVLQQAAALTVGNPSAVAIRFAALCHDLGKALSPKDNLPHHYGHEERGVEPIQQLCRRIKTPNECRDLAILVCRFHSHIHRIAELKPQTVVRLFDRLDVWRKPSNLQHLITVCIADSRGRLGFEHCDYPQAELALAYYQSAVAVDVQQIIAAGYQKQQIRQQLTAQRIQRIKQKQAQYRA